jgi:hypothetical protein
MAIVKACVYGQSLGKALGQIAARDIGKHGAYRLSIQANLQHHARIRQLGIDRPSVEQATMQPFKRAQPARTGFGRTRLACLYVGGVSSAHTATISLEAAEFEFRRV